MIIKTDLPHEKKKHGHTTVMFGTPALSQTESGKIISIEFAIVKSSKEKNGFLKSRLFHPKLLESQKKRIWKYAEKLVNDTYPRMKNHWNITINLMLVFLSIKKINSTCKPMANHYETSESLKGRILELDDTLSIAKIPYIVCRSFLFNNDGIEPNSKIFQILGIENPTDFCRKYYNYQPWGGSFPATEEHDFTALTAVVIALIELAETKSIN